MRFALVDRLLSIEPGHRPTARVVFPPTLEIFEDHFPGQPIVPGTLLTEGMGQTAGWLITEMLAFRRWPLLTTIDQAKFYRIVRPGEEIVMTATIGSAREAAFEAHVEAHVDGRRVARARLLFQVVELSGGTSDAGWIREAFAQVGGDAL